MPESLLGLSRRERVTLYRARADEALEAANRVPDHKIRTQLLLIAQGWRNLAELTEQSLQERHKQLL
jgi:hypothetical protein